MMRSSSITATTDQIKAQAQKVISRCRRIATFTEQPGCITRTFLSAPMHECHREIASWLKPLGVECNIDAVGNLRASYKSSDSNTTRLLMGSHLDTVPDAGAFDGILGVVMGVALLELLKGKQLPFAVELIGFSEEEGVRFKLPFIGSRAVAEGLDNELLEIKDGHGVSVREAIRNFGLNPQEVDKAKLHDDAFGYFEIHIEQGPVLESLGLALGAVEAIAGQSRTELTFLGRTNHAGTTPMHLRRDALAGAAEWILAVEREAEGVPGLVATVGAATSNINASNIISGQSKVSLDVRHRDDRVRDAALESLLLRAEEIAARRKLSLRRGPIFSQPAVEMDPVFVNHVEQAVRRAGCKPHRMISGAGHDAMILAGKIPTAMIFLRTPGGISHNPEENVNAEDVEKALLAGLNLLAILATSEMIANRRSQRA